MPEAKLAPNLPQWMLDHANRYLSSGGKDGHMYRITLPGEQRGIRNTLSDIIVPLPGRLP